MREYEGKTPFERETLKKIKTRFYFFYEDKSYYYEDIDTKQKDIENRNILIYCIGKRNSDELLLVYDYFHNNSSLFDVYDPVSTEDQDTKLSQSAEKYGFFVFGLSDAGCFSTKENKQRDIQKMISFVLDFQKSVERIIPSIDEVTEKVKYFINNKIYYEYSDMREIERTERSGIWSSQIDINNRVIRLKVKKNDNNTFNIGIDPYKTLSDDEFEEGSLEARIEKMIREKISHEYISDDADYPVFRQMTDQSKIPECIDRLNKAVIAYQESWENRYELPYVKEFLERPAKIKAIKTKLDNDIRLAKELFYNDESERDVEIIVDDYMWYYELNELDLPRCISKDILVHIENEEDQKNKILRFMSYDDDFGNLSVETRSTLPELYLECVKFVLFVTSKKDYFGNDFCFCIDKSVPDDIIDDLDAGKEYTKGDVFFYNVISTSEQTWKHINKVISLKEAVQTLQDVVKDTQLISINDVSEFKTDSDDTPQDDTPSTYFFGVPELKTYCSTAAEITDAVEKHYTILMEYQRRLAEKHPELLNFSADPVYAEPDVTKETPAAQQKRSRPVVPIQSALRGFDKAKVNSMIIAETEYKKTNGESIKVLIVKTAQDEVKVSCLKEDLKNADDSQIQNTAKRYGLNTDIAEKTIFRTVKTSELKKTIDFISVCILTIETAVEAS